MVFLCLCLGRSHQWEELAVTYRRRGVGHGILESTGDLAVGYRRRWGGHGILERTCVFVIVQHWEVASQVMERPRTMALLAHRPALRGCLIAKSWIHAQCHHLMLTLASSDSDSTMSSTSGSITHATCRYERWHSQRKMISTKPWCHLIWGGCSKRGTLSVGFLASNGSWQWEWERALALGASASSWTWRRLCLPRVPRARAYCYTSARKRKRGLAGPERLASWPRMPPWLHWMVEAWWMALIFTKQFPAILDLDLACLEMP